MATDVEDRAIGGPALGRLWDVLPEARIVGGAVRDTLAGRPVADIDLATPRLPAETLAALKAAGLRAIPTGLAHGTVTALVDGAGFEVTTLRRDVVTDGRHAMVAFTDDWRADAARRDFTINALSMDRAGTVFDYFGGRDDLAAGVVRFVGHPAARIAEDFLRVLRFFRFHARYGTAPPDAATEAALVAGAAGLARLSPERVWSELRRILLGPGVAAELRLMARLGVLAAVLPGALDPDRLERVLPGPPEPMLRLAALTDAPPAVLAAGLRLSGAELAVLTALREGPAAADADDAAQLRRVLAEGEHVVLRAWLDGQLAAAARLGAMRRPVFPVQGRDLLARGAAPGPALGQRLAELRAEWLEGGCVAGVKELLK